MVRQKNIEKIYRSIECGNIRLIYPKKTLAGLQSETGLIGKPKVISFFIDADAMLPGTAEVFMSNWLKYLVTSRVICGGIIVSPEPSWRS